MPPWALGTDGHFFANYFVEQLFENIIEKLLNGKNNH